MKNLFKTKDNKKWFLKVTIPFVALNLYWFIRSGLVDAGNLTGTLFIYSILISWMGPEEHEKRELKYPIFITITFLLFMIIFITDPLFMVSYEDPMSEGGYHNGTNDLLVLFVFGVFAVYSKNGIQRFWEKR